jgi:cytochrome b6-f complex iron-sulfur subunit
MERKKFIKQCCCTLLAFPAASVFLSSCASVYYYASTTREGNKITVPTSEFIHLKKGEEQVRQFVLFKINEGGFPVCLYRLDEGSYLAALLECTHRGCELNVGGGLYTCPCHGSEFSIEGKVLEGPAEEDLKLFKTESDNEFIYVYLS